MRKTRLTRLKWIVTPVAILLLATTFYNPPKNEEKNDVIRVAISRAPITFDSRLATDAVSIRLLKLISKGLIRLDEEFKPQPAAAISFSHENYQIYKFQLNNLTFSDGSVLNSKTVKEFYMSMLDPKTKSPMRGRLLEIKEIKTPSDQEVEFHLQQPSPYFWSVFEMPITKSDNNTPIKNIGLGPFNIHKYKSEQFIEMSKSGNINTKKPLTIRFSFIKDPVVRLLKLMRGDTDVLHNDLSSELFEYGAKKGFKAQSISPASYTYIGFNFRGSALTSDLKVRQAIAHAINREEIIQSLLSGRADPAFSLLLPTHPAYSEEKPPLYSPEKSRSLLKDLGYGDDVDEKRLKLRLSITTNPFIQRLSQIIQRQLGDVGIDLEIASSEWGTFYGNVKKGNFEMFILTWVGAFQPDIYNTLFHGKNAPPIGSNRGKYANERLDQLLNRLMAEVENEKQKSLAQQVQAIQNEELIYLPLWRRHHVMLLGDKVSGCRLNQDGGYEGLSFCKLEDGSTIEK